MPPAQRSFWKRKRWIAAAVLWLVIAYPLSAGPVAYCVGRGWLAMSDFNAVYKSTEPILPIGGYFGYLMWWHRLGEQHGASE